MTDISIISIFLAALMPYIWVGYAKFSIKGYDNENPRDFLSQLEGAGKRAHAAQLNSFEAFPIFAASVIVANLSQVEANLINGASLGFIVFRGIYGIAYIKNFAAIRSVVWSLAFVACIALLAWSIF